MKTENLNESELCNLIESYLISNYNLDINSKYTEMMYSIIFNSILFILIEENNKLNPYPLAIEITDKNDGFIIGAYVDPVINSKTNTIDWNIKYEFDEKYIPKYKTIRFYDKSLIKYYKLAAMFTHGCRFLSDDTIILVIKSYLSCLKSYLSKESTTLKSSSFKAKSRVFKDGKVEINIIPDKSISEKNIRNELSKLSINEILNLCK